MFRNLLKYSFRSLRKNKGTTFLNLTGLSVGIACCLLIMLFVNYELGYDKFHPSHDKIIRITNTVNLRGKIYHNASDPNILKSWLVQNFGQVKYATRFFTPFSLEVGVAYKNNVFEESGFIYADKDFFNVFDGYKSLQGNLETALSGQGSIVITKKIAEKYFGSENPIGKKLKIKNKDIRTVTAVIKDPPSQSHFNPKLIASDAGMGIDKNLSWGSPNYFTYALLKDKKYVSTLEGSINKLLNSKIIHLVVQPLTDIHLHSNYTGELEQNGDIRYIYLFSAIALLILLVACINYINLTTARSVERAKEVGILKVVGAYEKDLFVKFLAETVLTIIPAIVIAHFVVEIIIPSFNSLTGRNISLSEIPVTNLALFYLVIVSVVTALSGAYPALVLSGFKPVQVLKGKFKTSKNGILLRRVLVIMQFSVSVFLIIGTIVIYSQLHFLKEKNLGYNKEHILNLKIDRSTFNDVSKLELLKNELETFPEIKNAGASSFSPVSVPAAGWGIKTFINGKTEGRFVSLLGVDEGFIPTLNIKLISGRNFNDIGDNTGFQYIVNEAYLKMTGLTSEQVLGTKMSVNYIPNSEGEVVGVVKNFNTRSLHNEIEPVAMLHGRVGFNTLLIKLAKGNPSTAISDIESAWKKLEPGHPFSYQFLDQAYDNLYKSEQKTEIILEIFAIIAILIASLGLYGLTTYAVILRAKEVSVRKVLGAKVSSIIFLFSKESLVLLLIGFVIASPVAYVLSKNWLANFAYHVQVVWWMFAVAVIGVAIITVLSGLERTVRVAYTNPANVLRNE